MLEQLCKMEFMRLNRELQQARDSDLEGFVREEDIEDQIPLSGQHDYMKENAHPDDALMADEIEQQEEAELDAILSYLPMDSSLPQSHQCSPRSSHYSDDEDYDALFMDLISHDDDDVDMAASQDVEMS
jgi:hypothetical protein